MRKLTEEEISEIGLRAEERASDINENASAGTAFVPLEGDFVARVNVRVFTRQQLDDMAARAVGNCEEK